jgi:uroporphyrinogen decarboxylase
MVLPLPYPRDAVFARRIGADDEKLPPASAQLRRWRDEWGATWASLTEFDKGEVVEPTIADWSQLDKWRPPDLGRAEDYAAAAQRFSADEEHFRIGQLPGFTFNVARKLRKLDNYLCDLVLYRDEVLRLNETVRAELLKAIDRFADAGADAVMFPEDWGTQDRLMISPDMWREVFRPEFEALAGRARRRGMHVIMHSCGKMTDIIDDAIDCGVSCFQFDQPRLHGIELLSQRYGGRAAFWCPVDIQTTLQTRDPDKIRSEARLLIEKLGCFRGGFVAGYYAGNEAIGLTPDVQDIACKAFVEFGS